MITIREWTEEDIAQIAQLEQRCFEDAWPKELLADVLTYSFLHGFLIEDNGKILGYCCLRILFETADVDNIAVDEAERGKGYGDILLTLMETRAVAMGATECLLEVRVSNTAARGLYEKHGFVEIGVRKKYYSNGEDALVMRKEL